MKLIQKKKKKQVRKCRVVHHKKEPYDVYIGRPSVWQNVFKIGEDGSRETVLKKYREWLLSRPNLVKRAKKELAGKVLGCWCKPLSCHGDVLAEIVNQKLKEVE